MQIDTRNTRTKPRGFGTWLFSGPGERQVVYSGWWADAATYLKDNYGAGHWLVAA